MRLRTNITLQPGAKMKASAMARKREGRHEEDQGNCFWNSSRRPSRFRAIALALFLPGRCTRILRTRFSTAFLLGMSGLGGCNMFGGSAESSKSYPTTPPTVATTEPTATTVPTTMPTLIKVPADATELSSGDYPPPAFAVPNQAGTIMVVDLDGDPTVAVASTTVSSKDFGSKMSITDVPNMTISMNKLHKYRIVFVPNKGTTP